MGAERAPPTTNYIINADVTFTESTTGLQTGFATVKGILDRLTRPAPLTKAEKKELKRKRLASRPRRNSR